MKNKTEPSGRTCDLERPRGVRPTSAPSSELIQMLVKQIKSEIYGWSWCGGWDGSVPPLREREKGSSHHTNTASQWCNLELRCYTANYLQNNTGKNTLERKGSTQKPFLAPSHSINSAKTMLSRLNEVRKRVQRACRRAASTLDQHGASLHRRDP